MRSTAKKNAAPTTVAERRRAIRGTRAGDAGPRLKKARAEIDLTQPSARKALAALYPRPENETLIPSTPELERAALDYIEAREAEARAKERKEIAGNVLCNAIQKNLGIAGDGWKAQWDMSKGNVDWTSLAKELQIPDETIAKHRRPDSRGLEVRELAQDG